TLTLSGANTFTGGANISAGKVIAGNSNPSSSFDDSLAVYVNDGATYELGGSEVIGQLTGAGSIILGSHKLTAYNGGTSGTFSGVISGTGHFAVAANASATLTGNSTYTGETILAANATLTLGANGTSGSVANSSLISFADGATL
ncbi:autotransporter-associated beta strand repeat-containing protein, partial [Polynucleobacter sp. es-MAR-4]|uniref:autotransporter-associated beta strand repeat-containing protein n=1 Tax=Polynucleobacter sp. es-MAR-4 TaxID=1855655 RepID=UPI001C0AA4F1